MAGSATSRGIDGRLVDELETFGVGRPDVMAGRPIFGEHTDGEVVELRVDAA